MRCTALLVALWLSGLAGAQTADFDQQAARLFTKTYHHHAWQDDEHTVDRDDWSLPPWAKAAPYSGVQINPALVGDGFPGRLLVGVRGSWRDCEPREGQYDFEPLRRAIVAASAGGRRAVRLGLGAAVWETRWFAAVGSAEVTRTEPGTAPPWLRDHGVPIIEEKPNSSIPFQVVNLDIYHPEYHRRYLALVAAFGRSGIPLMPELDLCYVHLSSASRGEEGAGPPVGDARRPLFEQRLRAWAAAFGPEARKLCLVSNKDDDLRLALSLGMGQRNGFVEHYMMHTASPGMGQTVDADGYLVVDERCPLIAENRASGDENEEYTKTHVTRFGPIETFAHRYREATLRMLQMRRNFVWAEGGPWLINPPLLHYLALELGQTVSTAPDAWCYLRESTVNGGRTVRNFERWLYQRDADGARTAATERVDVPATMFEFDKAHRYDLTARRTQSDAGQREIRFGLDDTFLSGGPWAVAVKVTYLDRGRARWQLEYQNEAGQTVSRPVVCGDTGQARTATFILRDAVFAGVGYRGADLRLRATQGDAVVRFVRVIKLDPPAAPALEGR